MPGEIISHEEFDDEVRPENQSGYKDIGVSMAATVLEHKKGDGCWDDGDYCYWTMPNGVPESIGIGSKLWVASDGQWRGYFVIFAVDQSTRDEESDEFAAELHFWSESWTERERGTRKPFQGFTYKVPEA